MTKKEFNLKMVTLVQEIADTDDELRIMLATNDIEKLYDEHIKEVKQEAIIAIRQQLLKKSGGGNIMCMPELIYCK